MAEKNEVNRNSKSKNTYIAKNGEERVKKPRGDGWKYSPVIGDNGIYTKPGDNSKIAGLLYEIGQWGVVDRTNVQEMEDRFWRYVQICLERDIRVTNQAAYLAMGISRDDVHHWENGISRTPEHCTLIKKVKAFCGAYREMLGANGKLNPATLIWWQKNYDGMKDVQEVVISPKNPLGDTLDQKELEAKIADIVIDED